MKSDDYTSEFPAEFISPKRGVLRLQLSSLMMDEEEVMKFCHYETVLPGGQVASFHPDLERPPEVTKWQETFDTRFDEFEREWPGLLRANAAVVAKKVKGWMPPEKSIEDLLTSLQIRCVLISADESVTLRFITSPLLQHHDLGVTFDRRNNVTNIELEG